VLNFFCAEIEIKTVAAKANSSPGYFTRFYFIDFKFKKKHFKNTNITTIHS